jgi:Mrp family chromosome partitioning ATPase/capsular polysaccharide biosynthesis protein
LGHLLRVRAGWILAVAAMVTLTAAALSMLQTPVYRSTAQALVGAEYTPGGAPPHEPSMGTEKELAASPAVAELASRTLEVPVAELLSGLTVAVPVDTNVLTISYDASSPATAQRRAQGMALAYVSYKRSPPFRSLPEQAAVIRPADLPDGPVSPNTPLNIGVGLAAGLVLGFLVALVRDRLDDRVRGVAELEHRLLPVLEVVPSTEGPAAVAALAAAPESATAQAYSLLGEKILRSTRTARTTTVVVTSPIQDDGRSAVAVNLAAALALAGRRVVLVDADVRLPGDDPGGPDRPGFLDVLSGQVPLLPALQPTAVHGLAVLGVGHPQPGAPARVIGPRWADTSAQLAETADIVVVEAAPVLRSADAVRVGQNGALVVLCLRAGSTTRTAVDRAVAELEQSGARVLGCVLTEAPRRGLWRLLPRRRRGRRHRAGVPAEARLSRALVVPPHPGQPQENGHRRIDPEALRRRPEG